MTQSRFDKVIEISKLVANVAVALSLFFTGYQIMQAKNASYESGRFSTWTDLFDTFDNINEYIAKNSIKTPLYPEFKSDNKTAILLFHHLNLSYKAWLYRDIGTLNDDEFDGFQRWTDKTLFPWLEKDPCVARDMQTILNIGDLYPSRFIEWFKNLPGYSRAIRSAGNCSK